MDLNSSSEGPSVTLPPHESSEPDSSIEKSDPALNLFEALQAAKERKAQAGRAIPPSGHAPSSLSSAPLPSLKKVQPKHWAILGGAFALYVAHHAPECVRGIITLGSPVTVGPEGSQSPPVVHALYRLVAHPLGSAAHAMQPRVRQLRARPSVPMSCLYSASDGVVPAHQAQFDGDPALHENIRVPGSHCGLGFNPWVLRIVADRLAQPEGHWRPYQQK